MIARLSTCRAGGTDVYENLALERLLTETVGRGECVLYLWRNQHTVVIGRNQNAWQECRTTQLERDGGHLARRLSGGGAVYHDLGNLNFTFCLRTEDFDLPRQQSVLLRAVRSLGIPAELSGRNDLIAEGKKFSGNSFYSHAGRSFHNGTLLLSADLETLGKYLTPPRAKLTRKGVASVRARVCNLREFCPGLTVEQMETALIAAFEQEYGLTAEPLSRASLDAQRLEQLRRAFASWDWIYGRMRPFTFSCEGSFDWGGVTLQLAVRDGAVDDAEVYTDALDADLAETVSQGLRGCRFTVDELCRRIGCLPLGDTVKDDLCALLLTQDI